MSSSSNCNKFIDTISEENKNSEKNATVKLWKIKKYSYMKKENIEKDGKEYDIEKASILIKNDKGYHIRLLDDDTNYHLFFDIEKNCDFKQFKEDFSYFVDKYHDMAIDDSDYLYTENEGSNDKKHVIVRNYNGTLQTIKNLVNSFLMIYKKYNNGQVDTSVYKNGWFRLPNQSKEDKKNTKHIIIKGKLKDFLLCEIDYDSFCLNEFFKNKKNIKFPYKPSVENKLVVNEGSSESKSVFNKVDNGGFKDDFNKNIKNKFKELIKILDVEKRQKYDDWIKIGMVLCNESDNTDLLKEVWDFFSSKTESYNKKELNEKWESFKNSKLPYEKKLKIGTLINFAMEDDEKECKKWIKQYPSCHEHTEYREYIEIKKEIEENYFKLIFPSKFYDIENKTCISQQDMEFILKNRTFESYDINKVKKIQFYDIWIKDKNIRTYKRLVFNLLNNHSKDEYNTFTGFKFNSNTKSDKNKLKNILKLFNHVFTNEKELKAFFDCIAWIRQKPDQKTEILNLLYSDTKGVGKDTIIESILFRIFDGLITKIDRIEDLEGNFNEVFCNKLIVYGDEIDQKARKIHDFLKSIITRKKIVRKAKFEKETTIEDYCNYFFTTNNPISIFVEEGDRRDQIFHCNENKLTKEEYIEIHNDIQNDEIMIHFDAYLREIELPKKLSILETEYKRKLQHNNLPAYIQMIYKDHENFADKVFIPKDLYNLRSEYSKLYHVSDQDTFDRFSKKFSSIFKQFKKKTEKRNVYIFPKNLYELLKETELSDLLQEEEIDKNLEFVNLKDENSQEKIDYF